MDFLQKQVDFVDLMIKHIGTSAIMDLLLRMLTCIEPQQLRQDVLTVGTSSIVFIIVLNTICQLFVFLIYFCCSLKRMHMLMG